MAVNALPDDLAARMARLAISNIGREYPNHPGHVLYEPSDLRSPRELHPAFFGSFDWHSSVHQHWLLARLLRLGALRGSDAESAHAALGASLTRPNLATEAAYLRERPAFERTYGWAWVLRLADELEAWADPDAAAWASALSPLRDTVRANWLEHLGRSTYPIRAGTHANSAFALTFAIDHARSRQDHVWDDALRSRATEWFADDRDYPAHLEPGGDDFLSPTLVEATLMTRVLEPDAFARWFGALLPTIPPTLLEPVSVADRTDPKTVHLDGLNLSRAWCWRVLARARLGNVDRDTARDAGERHLATALPHLFDGHYVATHWTSSFALLALTA